jgi:hypothetical protein
VKEASLKMYLPYDFIFTTAEKTQLHCQDTDQWLPEVEEGMTEKWAQG